MGVWWAASRRKQHLSLKNLLRRQQTDTPSTTMSEEKLGKLRGKLKEMNLLKVVEGDRKNNVCNNEIAKLREKAEKNEAIVTTLEEQIEGFGKRLEELEELEGAAGEREDLNEEKVTFLEGQLKETETRADAAERMHAVLSNVIVEMETEIAGWTQKIVDMEHTMVEMDNLADDPNYDLSKKYGKTAASAASPSGFGSRSAMFETKTEESDSRASSRASMRGGSLSKPPKDPTPEPESEEEEEEEEAPPAPPPAAKPTYSFNRGPPPAEDSDEESEEESSEEESSDEE